MTGRSHDVKTDKTTIGRVEDNSFQIAEPSVSSHHCEVLVRGNDVIVKDLNSTNGTYINGEKITESPIKPGQILRLGQIEMRLETDAAGAPAASKKPLTQRLFMCHRRQQRCRDRHRNLCPKWQQAGAMAARLHVICPTRLVRHFPHQIIAAINLRQGFENRTAVDRDGAVQFQLSPTTSSQKTSRNRRC